MVSVAYTYVLKCKDNSYYIGSTRNIKKRFSDHQKSKVRHTMSKLPVKLIFLKGFENYSQALFFEKRIKSWKKRSSIEKMIKKADNLVYCPVV